MNFLKVFFVVFMLFQSLPSYSIFLYDYSRHKPLKYDRTTALIKAFEKEPIQSIDMAPYKDFLIDSDYTEIMKLMKENNLYKTLLKDIPFHVLLYKNNSKDIYAYAKYYLNGNNIIFSYSLSGELINIKIPQYSGYPRLIYVYSPEGQLIEVSLDYSLSGYYYRFKPNSEFIESAFIYSYDNLIIENNIISNTIYKDSEFDNNKTKKINSANNEIFFSQGRKNNNNSLTLQNNKTIANEENIINRIVYAIYDIWIMNYPSPLSKAPFYDVNTARNYVMRGEQPPQTIDMSEYKEYMIDKDRDEIIKDFFGNTGLKKHNFFHAKDFIAVGFYNFELFTGYYSKQYVQSNLAFYYNIKGELQKIEIRPKETAFKLYVKKIPEFPLKSYFYSKDGNLMFINLIVNEHDCYLFKPNNEFYSLWSGYVEFDSNYYQKGLRGDILH